MEWLYSISSIGRRKRAIVYEISGIKEEKEAVYDTAHDLYGEEAKTAIKLTGVCAGAWKGGSE